MGKRVEGEEALALFCLLEQLDKGVPLTSEIQQELCEISNLILINKEVKHLPHSIEYLTNLKELNLRINNLSSLPESLCNLSNLQTLDISENPLSTLPEFLGNLSNLKTLNISETGFYVLPECLGNLSNLQELNISFHDFSSLPKFLANLSSLQKLNISFNNFSTLPEFLGKLSNLQVLNISENNLSSLPEFLGNLSNLQTLNISGNELSSLPEFLGKLSNLQILDISDNPLSSLPEFLGNLSNLQTLYISNNNLSSLPESLGNLSNLQTLSISGNRLSSLPDSLGNLSNLQILNINQNDFYSFPDSLGNLSNLKILNINENNFSFLPNSLINLSNLQCLDVSYTKIDHLSPWIGLLKQLILLDLSGLDLRSLPSEILDLNLPFAFSVNSFITNSIGLYNTTLSTQPISLFKQPREFIQAYFDSPKIPVHETKVIFLGDGGAGKTHTIHRIQNNCQLEDYYTEMTPGVEITSFQTSNNDLTLNFWDFGGQEIMPSIHRCFLTQRALYVIVVSTRTGNLTVQARHWLKTIEAFAPGAPVLIAVNCWDNTTSCGVNNELLYEEFPNLRQTVIFSAKCSSQEEFYQNLLLPIEELSRKMDSYSMELPESWFHIEQALRTQENPYITGADYLQICYKNGWTADEVRTFAFAFLEHQNLLTEEVMTKLIDLLCRQEEVVLQQLGKNMSESKTPYQKLKGFISDTAKTGKDLQTLGKLMQAIYTVVPVAVDTMRNLLT